LAKQYKVSIRVISQKGTCEVGHRTGDEWILDKKTPEGLCPFAFYAIFPSLTPLMFGGSFPWEADPDAATAACPDAENPVVFELRRLSD
jgi:uncharacterized repeat protein (TIGR04076 family)